MPDLLYGVRYPQSGGAYDDSQAQPLEIDPVGPWLVVVDEVHHEIHEGESFTAHAGWASVASGTSKYLRISVDSVTYPHATFAGSASGAYTVEVFEGGTTSANGTAVPVYNRNRNSSKTGGLTITYDPTVTGDGNRLGLLYGGGGAGATRVGGSDRAAQEFILKPSTLYLLKITSGATGTNLGASIDWYVEGAG